MSEQTQEATAAADAAAFESGYTAVRADTTQPSEAPVEKPQTEPAKTDDASARQDAKTAEPAKAAAAEPDPWEGVPSKVRETLEAMQTQLAGITKLPGRLSTLEGHIGNLNLVTRGLKAATEKLEAAAATARTAATAQGATAPTDAEVKSAAKNPELWKQLKEDFPVWADAIEPELAELRAQISALKPKQEQPVVDVAAIKGEVTQDVQARIDAAVEFALGMKEIAVKHGNDWKAQIATPAFEAWFAAQPADVQALSASKAPNDAMRIVDLFAEHRKKETEKAARQKRLDAVGQPKGSTTVTPMTSDDEAFVQGYQSVAGSS